MKRIRWNKAGIEWLDGYMRQVGRNIMIWKTCMATHPLLRFSWNNPRIDNLMAHWKISVGFLCILHWPSRHEHPWHGKPLPCYSLVWIVAWPWGSNGHAKQRARTAIHNDTLTPKKLIRALFRKTLLLDKLLFIVCRGKLRV